LLLDSNVLIDVLRGEEPALRWLETRKVEQWLERFERLELSQSIAHEAVRCRRERGLKLPDAIILATARIHGCSLVTRNTRDFPESLEGVLMPYAL
jgi:predicted nucleic acid-binding protein